jgi:formate-dependent nitrite reductase cytochrome c552 subunit
MWHDVAGPTTETTASVAKPGDSGFFRVLGSDPSYVGSDACAECHNVAPQQTHSGWMDTAHATAFDTLKKIGQDKNSSCLPCHTVGYKAGGYVDIGTTPHLTGVQCENCHGPGGAHVDWASGSALPPKILPITTPSAMLCGGCHNGFHHPTYDEWKTAGHAEVIASVASGFMNTNIVSAQGRMASCGSCHSGAVRFQMENAYNKFTGNARTNVAWPTGIEAAETSVTCVTCHDTHNKHVYTNVITGLVYTNQLRHPLTSTNNFSYNTGATFASQFNPATSLCANCHNARGASVTGNGRPPHHSPQYNIMMGNIGVTDSVTPTQGAHWKNPLQCVGCHTHGHNQANPTPGDPAYTGHGFRWTVQACQECHKSPTGPLSATNLLSVTQMEIRGLIAQTKTVLDVWATTKNTNTWATLYGALGWEYASPGQLSNPTGSSSLRGPTDGSSGSANMQAQIPLAIREARYNLYLVEHDGSHGIHNAPYARYLLEVAQRKVNAELAK